VLSAQVQLKRLCTSPKWEIKMSFDHTQKNLKEMLKIAKRIEINCKFTNFKITLHNQNHKNKTKNENDISASATHVCVIKC